MAKDGIDFEIDTKQLIKTLKTLPIRVQKNVMVGATRAGANTISKEAKANAPKRTGTLKKSIGITRRKSRDKTIIHFSVSPRKGGKNDGFYGRFVELGTSNMQPQPFLRPALENQTDEAVKASAEYISKRLPKEVEKAKR